MSPIRVAKISELRRPTRNKESVVEHLEEFHAAKLKLHSGLKPQEAIEISIPKSTERGRKHLRASFKKRIRAYSVHSACLRSMPSTPGRMVTTSTSP